MEHNYSPQIPAPPGATVNSGSAIASLIFGILAWMTGLPGLIAIILGHVALGRIKRNPGLGGKGMAVAGLILGYLQMLALIVVLVFIGFAFFVVSTASDSVRLSEMEMVDSTDAEFLVILPKGHDPSVPIPVAIWLHGYGADTMEISLFEEDYQKRANDLKIGFVGISATAKLEEGSYEWTEDLETDYQYLLEVFARNEDKITPKWGKVVLFGFSQGAKVAGDLAMNYPEKFSGAILMSPGGNKNKPDSPPVSDEKNTLQHFYCFVGKGEAYGNVSLTAKYKRAIEKLGASVEHKEYPGMEDHSTPPDFEEKLSGWIRKILQGD